MNPPRNSPKPHRSKGPPKFERAGLNTWNREEGQPLLGTPALLKANWEDYKRVLAGETEV